jgi:selenocysteine-specific elongation factor
VGDEVASQYYTIGMAGHIDHGKTTLTKALTNVNTDRLKEEKERNISIELGYAPLDLGDGTIASIVDVPGHERFIRQMIAGVAGIDLVILVIAADEGVMPQTREHLEILSFLGIKKGIVAVTKIDRVDDEMKEIAVMDINDELIGTPFESAEMIFVDSLKGVGILQLKQSIIAALPELPKRNFHAPFRMPIDQVFTLQGKGTILRGTVFEGSLQEGQTIYIKPSGTAVKARSIQVHNKQVTEVFAGQRAAINITGVSVEDVIRGDVLASSDSIKGTVTIDVSLQVVKDLDLTLKQRESIKLNVGTKEVMGQIVFFDRNDLLEQQTELILCQIRLEEAVAVLRGDKFIIRRPSPAETIGGGWIIDPNGSRYRYGDETIKRLKEKMEDPPEDRIIKILEEVSALSVEQISEKIGTPQLTLKKIIDELLLKELLMKINDTYVLTDVLELATEEVIAVLTSYHQENTMRIGMNKAELFQVLGEKYPSHMLEFMLEQASIHNKIKRVKQYISLNAFKPNYPTNWKKRMENIEQELRSDGLKVKSFEEYIKNQGIPQDFIHDLKHYLTHTNKAIVLDEKHLLDGTLFLRTLKELYEHTKELGAFSLQDAKQVLDLSRKYLIMYLEMLDREKITRRKHEQREWVKDTIAKYYL